MEAQIMALASNPSAENTDVRKLRSLVNSIDSKATVNYDAVYKQLQDTQQELDKKEVSFKKSIAKNTDKFEKNASEFRKYADIVDGYKDKIDNFDNDMLTAKKEIEAEKNAITAMRQQVEQEVLNVNDLIARTKRKASIPWIAGKRPPGGSTTIAPQPQGELQLEDTKILNKQGIQKTWRGEISQELTMAIINKLGPRPDSSFHLDHIIPLSVFDLTKKEHRLLANSPENLRWLPGEENCSKNDFIDWPLIKSNPDLLNIAQIIGLNDFE